MAGLLMGGLIGAGTMLLLAPQSGKKTLAKLEHDGLELRDQVTEGVQDAVAQVRSTASRVMDSAQKQTKELRHRSKELFEDQKEVVSDAVEAGKEAVHNLASS
ncbi:MAG: YtxH domain-containing protein [Anaerolineaceae bacterium]|nr:YtxH domain-containing protein [Anaerolineaceae bacterium]